MKMMNKVLPIKHLSARVPWHDNRWNGSTCCNVIDNSFCRILPRIDNSKDPSKELPSQTIEDHNFPPCIAEKGTFLSPRSYLRNIEHSWRNINPLFHHFEACNYVHKPYSLNAVPFLWMRKNKATDPSPHYCHQAAVYELDYKIDLEDEIDKQLGFDGNSWVQHPHNQKVLLDAFFGCLKKEESLIFFYCKHTPFSEPNERTIVGVAKVRGEIGDILNYGFNENEDNGHRSYPWDRCVQHSLTDTDPEGFLLPYHDIIDYCENEGLDIDYQEFAAYAPDFMQFSYASELVEHDTAIDALLAIAEMLKKTEKLLGKRFTDKLAWIDSEISRIWDMRGGFPGMGPVLSAMNIADGNTIAWEIQKHILNKDGDLLATDPWSLFEECLQDPNKHFSGTRAELFSATAKKIWTSKPQKKKECYKLFSRLQLNNDQAGMLLSGIMAATVSEILQNPYLIYEKTRLRNNAISFRQVDKVMMPPDKIKSAFPLPDECKLEDQLDERRSRSLAVHLLEEAADQGHSLLPFDQLLHKMQEFALDEPFPIDEDVLISQLESDFFTEEILHVEPSRQNTHRFCKLVRLEEIKKVIRQRINPQHILGKEYGISKDWLDEIITHPKFGEIKDDSEDIEDELRAREEKAQALRVITNYSFSVLIGPAGSGKTTLLEIFEMQPEIRKGGLLKLAPTGKARVKLGSGAKTLAQFLYPDRYDTATGRYFPNPDAPKYAGARNVIVDEASMITEDQLAALLDALGAIERLILVGDYRQLPPIGTGRPFVDIIDRLKPEIFNDPEILAGPAYAELVKIRRQAKGADRRLDTELSLCFAPNPTKENIETFTELAQAPVNTPHLKTVKWYSSDDFRTIFTKILEQELQIDPENISHSFDRTIGAVGDGNYLYFNTGEAEYAIEDWQVISPVNGYGYGVKEINKLVQSTYRRSTMDLALNVQRYKRKVPKPFGNDNIIYGDKVINLRNITWEDWQKVRPFEQKEAALNYIANGEIGVVTGEFKGKASNNKQPNVEIAFSTQKGYSYIFTPKLLKDEGRYPIDLAYAITVHKSQGSGFGKVF